MFALVKNETIRNPMTSETSEIEVINLFSPHTLFEDKDGIQHSPDTLINWTVDQKQDHGIYDVAYSIHPDVRFYNVTQNPPEFDSVEKIVKVTFTSIPKDLEDGEPSEHGDIVLGLKSQYINQFKATANFMLSETDWMLVRKIEREVDVPADVATKRAAVVAEADRLETAISAVTDVEELITVVQSANFAG
jgi:hypothetical protein